MADCMQFLSENHLNGCQIFGWFGFLNRLKNWIWTKLRFSAHPYSSHIGNCNNTAEIKQSADMFVLVTSVVPKFVNNAVMLNAASIQKLNISAPQKCSVAIL